MYNLKKVRGKVVHKIIQEIVHNSIVSQKPMKLSIIYILYNLHTVFNLKRLLKRATWIHEIEKSRNMC